jgi:hypothetical protein
MRPSGHRRALLVPLGFALLLAMTLPAAAQESVPPPAGAPESAITPIALLRPAWEYAEYRSARGGGSWGWQTAERAIGSGNYRKFLRQIGLEDLAESAGGEMALFSALGREGWELVWCSVRHEATGLLGEDDVRSCLFKRRVQYAPPRAERAPRP